MALTRMSDQIGRVLVGRYRLLAPIGAGGSAQVFLAEDTRLRRRVAVKVLHDVYAGDEAFIRRFQSEAQAAAALNHPHLLSVFDWGQEDVPFLVTEYLGGGSLRSMLDQGSRLSVPQATLLGIQAARGLDHAHRQGLVHRDLKPANLLFGDDGRLRIADFGIARALADSAVTEPAGAVLGTARYASPEQAQGRPLSVRSDVYSLALVLVEGVTGEVPFAVDTTIGTLMARVSDPIPVPWRLEWLRPVLAEAGAVDPDDRPDAAHLAARLVRAAEDMDEPEPFPLAGALVLPDDDVEVDRDPTMLPDPSSDEVDEEPIVLPPAVDDLGWWGRRRARRAARRAARAEDDPRRSGRRRLVVALVAVLGVALLAAGAVGLYQLTRPQHDVPELTGLAVAEVGPLVEDLGFDVRLVGARANRTFPGEVLAQDPEPGEQLREGDRLTVTVSRGPTLVEVPRGLAGQPVEEATEALRGAGFRIGHVSEVFNELVNEGVVQAVPAAFEQVARGTPVDLVVSKGPRPRVVPEELVGRPYAEAAALLEAASLVPARVEEPSLDAEEGSVIRVDPAPGTSLPRDSTVTLVVAIARIEVPDVTGMDPDEAADALEAAGLSVSQVDGPPNRQVVRTEPAPGTLVEPGSSVVLVTRPGGGGGGD